MGDWASLRDVYGSAAGIPQLLDQAQATSDWKASAWEELWQRLLHQGSVEEASYEALPHLARIAAERRDVAVDPALFLFTAILAAEDDKPVAAAARNRNADAIIRLAPVAEHKLDLVTDRTDVLYALGAIAVLDGSTAWHRPLEALAAGELEPTCPGCGDNFYVELSGDGLVETDSGDAVQPADARSLGTAEAQFLQLCSQHGHTNLVAQLMSLFGVTTCPWCGMPMRLSGTSVNE